MRYGRSRKLKQQNTFKVACGINSQLREIRGFSRIINNLAFQKNYTVIYALQYYVDTVYVYLPEESIQYIITVTEISFISFVFILTYLPMYVYIYHVQVFCYLVLLVNIVYVTHIVMYFVLYFVCILLKIWLLRKALN